MAPSSFSARESPGRISSATGIGIRRTSWEEASWAVFSRRFAAGVFADIGAALHLSSSHLSKLAGQSLGAGCYRQREQLLQVFGIVDIDGDSRQVQYDARFACGLRGGQMRLEAVVAEAEWEQVRGTAEGGVGAASVTGRHEDAAFLGRVLQYLFKFPTLN